MYNIVFHPFASKKTTKLIKNNYTLENQLTSVLIKLKNNPFDTSLRTHKVISKRFDNKYSSKITGDLRLIWDFNLETEKLEIIEIYDIGGHGGTNGVY